MLREMSWGQFQEWRAYFDLEPTGERREDWRAASICASVYNAPFIQRGLAPPFAPKDFLLEFNKVEPEQPEAPKEPVAQGGGNWQRMKMIAQMHAAVANADHRKKNHV